MISKTNIETHTCKNCNHQFEGIVCNLCGQKIKYYSATPKGLFLEWWSVRKEDLLHFWFTTKQLLINPGEVIDDYLQGKRKKYYNSTNYFILIASIVTILTIQLRTVDSTESLEAMTAFYESLGMPIDEDNQGGAIAYNFIYTHYNIALMMTLPFLALGSFLAFRVFLRDKSRKVGEHFVMQLFCYGLLNFLLIPFIPFINPGNPESKAMLFTMVTLIIFYSYIYRSWYKINWFKAIIASVLAYLLYFLTFFLFIFGLIIAILLVIFIIVLIVKGFKMVYNLF